MTHTKEPWEIIEQQTRLIIKSYNRKADASGFGRTIAVIDGDWHPSSGDEGYYAISSYQEANARLIAAAPELLAACREGLSFMESVIEFNEMRGNTTPPDVIELRDRFAAAIVKAEEGMVSL